MGNSIIEKPEIVVVGMNHRTAPVEIREKLSLSSEEILMGLEMIKSKKIFKESFLFSTCNRVESVFVTNFKEEALKKIYEIFSIMKNIPISEFKTYFYEYSGEEAVKHVFKVSSSLDSMVIGEPQILGQVKDAYKLSVSSGNSKVILNRLFHRAFQTAKKVRTNTGIGGHAVSISYAAVELAKKIFNDLSSKKILLIGAGEMAELAVEHLIHNKTAHVFVANRTFERGLVLAKKFSGSAIRFEEVISALEWADIIISSTGAPDYILTKTQVKPVMKKRKNSPLFFIDIAVPRDIDPNINKINNVYVYDVDDLSDVVNTNMKQRQEEAIIAMNIVDDMASHFLSWKQNLKVVPTIVELREKIQGIVKFELEKTMKESGIELDSYAPGIEKMIDSICNKILHHPITFLKEPGGHRDLPTYLSMLRNLFNLDEKSVATIRKINSK